MSEILILHSRQIRLPLFSAGNTTFTALRNDPAFIIFEAPGVMLPEQAYEIVAYQGSKKENRKIDVDRTPRVWSSAGSRPGRELLEMEIEEKGAK